ncbi:Tartrate-resistant acid phosphatase type 5 [Podochytrium sp. JEL0797]|nr:Tartrate-resistant acid phosphatase type 5 [Podochytrium sp. JEL0797]
MFLPTVALLVANAAAQSVTTPTAAPSPSPSPAPLNFFDALIIGDWGLRSGNQSLVASAMNQWAQASSSEAVISVGDNFYLEGALAYDGVQSANDDKFKSVWTDIFNGVDLNVFATFIFIETDLLFYGYAGYSAPMNGSFAALGWNAGNNTIAKQLAWIENAIAAANNDAFVFVVGHHETYTCVSDANANMQTILGYLTKWNVSGYMNGHQHTLAGYITNNGKTLQMQAGSGGKIDSACLPLDNTFTAGLEVVSYGFAHLRLDKTGAYVNFVDETGSSVLALSVAPRVSVTGVTPQQLLAPSTDTSVHYVKPAVPQPSSIDYLIIGDWGNVVNLAHMKNVAAAMDSWAAQQNSSAVISLGDNFYGCAGTAYSYEGVRSTNDPKFTELWRNVFNGPTLKNLPWWLVLGWVCYSPSKHFCHRLYLTYDSSETTTGISRCRKCMSCSISTWTGTDFFYTERVQVDTGVWASFIFIETDLFQYGYNSTKNNLAINFALQGWNAASHTVEKQLSWLDNALSQANNDQYIFVIGHHPDFDCASDISSSINMTQVTTLINKWNASAYFSGHHHTLAYYYTNNGATLQVQNGAGGNADPSCLPASKAPGQELSNTFGFSHLNVNAHEAQVDFITENNTVAFSARVLPREPVMGVTADTTWLPTSPVDPAIHFVAPTCNPALPNSGTNFCPTVSTSAAGGIATSSAAASAVATAAASTTTGKNLVVISGAQEIVASVVGFAVFIFI